MLFNEKIDEYRRYPDQFFTVLAKVGGLVGMLKFISIFLAIYHQRMFERQYSQTTTPHKQSRHIVVNETEEASVELIEEQRVVEETQFN